jgi:hypothetical protein
MEKQIIELIARDRLEIPLSSMYQKVKRVKGKDAKSLANLLGKNRFESQRVYAYVEDDDQMKARGAKEAIVEFSRDYPKYGAILNGMIEEKRMIAEKHLYFGVNPQCRLTTEDYVNVMQSIGLSQGTARELYPDLLNVSRKLAKEREESRNVIVGKYEVED